MYTVLYRVANSLAQELGANQVYLIGGDEFVALLPWDRAEVELRLTRLLMRGRNLKWREFETPVTLSAVEFAIKRSVRVSMGGPFSASTRASDRGGIAGIWQKRRRR